MANPLRVAVAGATGETGSSIIDGLVDSGDFVSSLSPNALCYKQHTIFSTKLSFFFN